jgi:hypothetical protein
LFFSEVEIIKIGWIILNRQIFELFVVLNICKIPIKESSDMAGT